MRPQWPGIGMVRAELEHLPRREAFAEAHPGTKWERHGRVYIGHVPYSEDGAEMSITMKGDSWSAVLAALETYFSEDGERDTG